MAFQSQKPFKPITLQASSETKNHPLPSIKLQQYYRLLRMKKILIQTQQKMQNRINLFKKASQKILKQRLNQFKVFTKIQKSKYSMNNLERPKSRGQIRTTDPFKCRDDRQNQKQIDTKALAEQLYQKRIINARTIKEEKTRFKTLIQQRKKIDLQRKLQSASQIRRNRQNAQIARQNLERDRREHFQKELIQKCQREKEEFLQMQKQLSSLQEEEENALFNWKKTMEGKN